MPPTLYRATRRRRHNLDAVKGPTKPNRAAWRRRPPVGRRPTNIGSCGRPTTPPATACHCLATPPPRFPIPAACRIAIGHVYDDRSMAACERASERLWGRKPQEMSCGDTEASRTAQTHYERSSPYTALGLGQRWAPWPGHKSRALPALLRPTNEPVPAIVQQQLGVANQRSTQEPKRAEKITRGAQ